MLLEPRKQYARLDKVVRAAACWAADAAEQLPRCSACLQCGRWAGLRQKARLVAAPIATSCLPRSRLTAPRPLVIAACSADGCRGEAAHGDQHAAAGPACLAAAATAAVGAAGRERQPAVAVPRWPPAAGADLDWDVACVHLGMLTGGRLGMDRGGVKRLSRQHLPVACAQPCPAAPCFHGTTLSNSLSPAVLPLQVLDPQQHQALLQQQGRLGGMANGLGESALRGTDSDGSAAAAAAADAMQLDVAPMTAAAAEAAVAAQAAAAAAAAPAPPPITAAEAEVAAEFVHSALADEEGSPPGSGAGSSPTAAGGSTPPEQQAQAGAAEPSPAGEQPEQGATASPAASAAATAERAADGDAAMAAAEGAQQAGAAQAGATAGQPAGEGASGVTAMDASPAKQQQQQQQRPGEELQ